MSDDNQQHPSPNSFHEGGYRKKAYYYHNSGVHLPDQGDSRPPTEYPQQGNPSQADAPHDPLDGGGNVVQRQTSPRNLQQGKPSTDVLSLDKVVKDLKDSSGPVGGFVPSFPLSSAAPFPSARNVIQHQISPRNLQQGKLSIDVPSLDKVHLDCVCPPAGNVVQGQTLPANLMQGKPSTDVPSLDTAQKVDQGQTSPGNLQEGKPSTNVSSVDTVVKDWKDSPSPIGGSVPGFPHSSATPSPPDGNVVQHKTSPRNPQQEKPSTNAPSLDKVGNVVQHQTSPGNLQQGKPSTLDKVVKGLNGSSGPVGSSVPDFPPKEASCIRKCLAALSPCFG